ncbi:hypothetical protein ACFULT_23150 [Rhodococcus sp. NPDC057297]|uniref:hypothetical protein n=1 Tax=Rhodococcus sp. NPDC057297 TaxID=3346090 RepID=UPI00362E2AE3
MSGHRRRTATTSNLADASVLRFVLLLGVYTFICTVVFDAPLSTSIVASLAIGSLVHVCIAAWPRTSKEIERDD